MSPAKKKVTLCAVLIALNIAFIWGNSLLPREVSAQFSRLVGRMLDWLIPGQDTVVGVGEGNGILRKIAHFTEFCCLGVLMRWMAQMLQSLPWKRLMFPILAGAAVACIDETIQCFVPGRGPGILDVCIDAAGVALGVLILTLVNRKKGTVSKQ